MTRLWRLLSSIYTGVGTQPNYFITCTRRNSRPTGCRRCRTMAHFTSCSVLGVAVAAALIAIAPPTFSAPLGASLEGSGGSGDGHDAASSLGATSSAGGKVDGSGSGSLKQSGDGGLGHSSGGGSDVHVFSSLGATSSAGGKVGGGSGSGGLEGDDGLAHSSGGDRKLEHFSGGGGVLEQKTSGGGGGSHVVSAAAKAKKVEGHSGNLEGSSKLDGGSPSVDHELHSSIDGFGSSLPEGKGGDSSGYNGRNSGSAEFKGGPGPTHGGKDGSLEEVKGGAGYELGEYGSSSIDSKADGLGHGEQQGGTSARPKGGSTSENGGHGSSSKGIKEAGSEHGEQQGGTSAKTKGGSTSGRSGHGSSSAELKENSSGSRNGGIGRETRKVEAGSGNDHSPGYRFGATGGREDSDGSEKQHERSHAGGIPPSDSSKGLGLFFGDSKNVKSGLIMMGSDSPRYDGQSSLNVKSRN